MKLPNVINKLKSIEFKKLDLKKLISSVKDSKNSKSILIGAFSAILVLLVVAVTKFGFVTADKGIDTTDGPAAGKRLFILKTHNASQGDVVVVKAPGTAENEPEALILGSLFGSNDDYYAVYDGKVIWQVVHNDLRAVVFFTEPTQLP